MGLRAAKALPNVRQPVNSGLVRVMKSRVCRLLVASVGAMTLMLAADETFAASRGVSVHSTSHRLAAHMHRFHRKPFAGYVWPGDDGISGPNGEGVLDAPLPGDIRNSNANDIPWDWAHRYPPAVVPSGRPYVSTCGAETTTVPNGRGGTDQVNVFRCY
jgi:hypothetical protein